MTSTQSLLVGALISLFGSAGTQLLFWWVSLSHAKSTMTRSLRSELGVIRMDFRDAITGFRKSLENSSPPYPLVFEMPTLVFDASAGKLGDLRDDDLVDHLVEVYTELKSFGKHVQIYKGIDPQAIPSKEFNRLHVTATNVHLGIMNLHDRLCGHDKAQRVLHPDEPETRRYFDEQAALIQAGKYEQLELREWKKRGP